MTDKEILATVYRWMNQSTQRDEDNTFKAQRMIDCKDFIEQEWQRQDDERPKADAKSLGQFSDSWYGKDPCTNDIKEIERHRGLEIGEDGTVKEIL